MKKWIAVILSCVMAVSLAACGGSGGSSSKAETTAAGSQSERVPASQSVAAEAKETAFEEMTVVDNDECSITLTGIEQSGVWGYSITGLIENKNAEKTYMYAVESAAINGVQVESLFAKEVAPGKKANINIAFADSDLQNNGITEYTKIELTFRVYDTDDWLADEVAHETVCIYPYGEENAVDYVRESQPDDVILVDNDKVQVIALNYENDDIWGYMLNLYFVNKTDSEVMFSVEDASINGYMIDPFFAKEVLPGKCAFGSVNWNTSSLEENGIEAVQEIEMRVQVNDSNSWTELASETVTLNVE